MNPILAVISYWSILWRFANLCSRKKRVFFLSRSEERGERREKLLERERIKKRVRSISVERLKMDRPPDNDVCSICHDNFDLPCQANCSHWFCANCIMRVWHHSSPLQPCKCPICRRLITLLIPCESELLRHHDSESGQALENVEKYNRLFGGGSHSLIQRLQDLPFLLRRLFRELMDPQRSLPLVFRLRMVLAIVLSAAYVISPVDILPEGIVGIVGLLDDLLIVLVVFLHLTAVYRSTLLFRHGGT